MSALVTSIESERLDQEAIARSGEFRAECELRGILEAARCDHAANRLVAAAEQYRRALKFDGRSLGALLGLSLLARQSGQAGPALKMAEAALRWANNAEGAALALVHVGHCLAGLGQLIATEGAFRRVLAGSELAGNGETWKLARMQARVGLGNVLVAMGRGGEAAGEFRSAIAEEPEMPAPHFGLGNALALEEDWSEAQSCFDRVVEMRPQVSEAHFGVAFCCGKLGDMEGAIAGYRRAIELRPRFAGAWLNLGVMLVATGRDGLGAACYREVLRMGWGESDPVCVLQTRISTWLNLGHLERGRKRFAEALRCYGAALDLEKGTKRIAEIQVAFCSWHLEQGQFPQAWRALRLAEAAEVGNAEVANVKGILLLAEEQGIGCFHAEGLIQEAIGAFQEAEVLGHRTAVSNRGNALLRLGRCDEALRAHELAVTRSPEHAGARYNLALTQLRMGDFRWGWVNYEARWAFRDVHPRPRRFVQRRWEGEAGETVLVYAEQGLGDTVQFARYLPQVATMLMGDGGAAGLVVEVQEPLVRLMELLVQKLEGRFEGLRAVVVRGGDALPAFTRHCPLMSLPALCGTEVSTVPCETPYVGEVADATPGRGSARAMGGDNRMAVGLAWAGNPRYKADGERSTRLATFLPLLQLAGIRWVSLQKDAGAEIEATRSKLPEGCELDGGCSTDRDLADTAAVIVGLDLVITTDTVIAHLAGAMGKPVWLLLAWQADWRWMQERDTTPWYPTMRLFRQAWRSGWMEVVERVERMLEEVKRGGKVAGVRL